MEIRLVGLRNEKVIVVTCTKSFRLKQLNE